MDEFAKMETELDRRKNERLYALTKKQSNQTKKPTKIANKMERIEIKIEINFPEFDHTFSYEILGNFADQFFIDPRYKADDIIRTECIFGEETVIVSENSGIFSAVVSFE